MHVLTTAPPPPHRRAVPRSRPSTVTLSTRPANRPLNGRASTVPPTSQRLSARRRTRCTGRRRRGASRRHARRRAVPSAHRPAWAPRSCVTKPGAPRWSPSSSSSSPQPRACASSVRWMQPSRSGEIAMRPRCCCLSRTRCEPSVNPHSLECLPHQVDHVLDCLPHQVDHILNVDTPSDANTYQHYLCAECSRRFRTLRGFQRHSDFRRSRGRCPVAADGPVSSPPKGGSRWIAIDCD